MEGSSEIFMVEVEGQEKRGTNNEQGDTETEA